jgi:hypothetical protein
MAKYSTMFAILAALATWAAYLVLSPHLSTAFALLPGVAYCFWRAERPGAAAGVLFGGALLIDLALPFSSARYLVVSTLTAAIYVGLVEPYLSPSGILGNGLGLVVWLVLWRVIYLGYLVGVAFTYHTALPTAASTTSLWLGWLATGIVAWGLASLITAVLMRPRHSHHSSYAS